MAMASGKTAIAFSSENTGMVKLGSCCGMPPNLLPMVATGAPTNQTSNAAPMTPMIAGGIGILTWRRAMMMPSANRPTPVVAGFQLMADLA